MNASLKQPFLSELDELFNQFFELQGRAVKRWFELSSALDPVGKEEVWAEVLADLWRQWRSTRGLDHVSTEGLIGYWHESLRKRSITYLKRQAKRKCLSLPQDDVLPSHHMSARLGRLEASEVCLRFFTELTDLQVQIFQLHIVDGYSIRKIVACKLCDGNRPLKKHGVVKHLKAIQVKALKFRSGYN